MRLTSVRPGGHFVPSRHASGHYVIEPAVPSDDDSLRSLLRATPMDGSIRLSLEREPAFFTSAGLGNLATTVFVARDTATGDVVATAARAIRRAYVDGRETSIGYLSSLRIRPPAARSTLLARGYRYIHDLHADGQAGYYITTIFEENETARRVLTSERGGIPAYVPVGRLLTYLVPLYRKVTRPPPHDAITRDLTPATLPQALACVNEFDSGLQFAPCYCPQDFAPDSQAIRGLAPADIYVHRRAGQITGTLGVWDQGGFKQSVVAGYSRWLAALRPLSGAAARLGLAPKLPRVGEPLRCLYAALISSRDSDEAVFEQLLETAVAEHGNAGYAYLLLGLCDRHPFCRIVERKAAMKIASEIFLVYWRDFTPPDLPSTPRIPHLEIATL